jgi:hypothetical protein
MKLFRTILSNYPLYFGISAVLWIQGCNHDDNADISEDEQMNIAENSTISDNAIDEDLQAFDETVSTSRNGRIATCPVVTRDSNAKTITIDFGNGCQGRYGRSRTGKILITYGGAFDDSLANRTITFQNYTVGGRQVSGTIELKNFNVTDQGQLTADRAVIDYTITFPNGNNFVLNGTSTRTWLSGLGDGIPGNEVVQLTGSYSGTSTHGRTYTRTITTPVIADFNCRAAGNFLRVSGIEEMEVTKAKKNRTRTIDYGNGNCDNTITITVNGKSEEVTVND